MTILAGDIKILRSQVLLDTPEGGGAQTGIEVVDGQSNNLFPDVSELDRVYGRTSLRKFFPSVLTDNTDSYYGVRVIVSKPPEDPRVSASLFSTRDGFDVRTNARNRLESYLARGPKWAGHVLETQLTGQRAIQQAMRPADVEPKVGQGLVLTWHEGQVDEREQFVRVTKVSAAERVFTVQGRDVTRKVVTIEISDPLRYDFVGQTVQDFEVSGPPANNAANSAFLRDTRVADAARYFGIAKLEQDVVLGAASVTVDSVFTQLVPSSQAETPMLDLYGSGFRSTLTPAASGVITTQITATIAANARVYIGSPFTPGSLTLTLGSNSFTESGGVLKQGSTEVGVVEYDKGLLIFGSFVNFNLAGTWTLNFKPAAAPSRSELSTDIHVDQTNRGFNYTMNILPLPAPGSLSVSYVAQGKVYYLFDNGAGQLKGEDSSIGSGSVSYTTGVCLVTLGALPDADSDILFQWGAPVTTFVRDTISVLPAVVRFQLNKTLTPGAVSITWTDGATPRTASDNGLGQLTGAATGKVNYATGQIDMRPNVLPLASTVYAVATDSANTNSHTFSGLVPDGGGNVTATLPDVGGAPVIPGSVWLEWEVHPSPAQLALTQQYQQVFNVTQGLDVDTTVYASDKFVSSGVGDLMSVGNSPTDVGDINYTTRTFTINTNRDLSLPVAVLQPVSRPQAGIFATP